MTDRPVVIAVDDAQVCAGVVRLAALAGVAAHPVSTVELVDRWGAAPAVVVDEAQARSCVEARLPRRAGVLVVVPAEPSAQVWAAAVALGAERVLMHPRDERTVLDWLAAVHEPSVAARVLCCVPAGGGSGSSTLAAALALAAGARDQDVLLVDADPCAGGLHVLVGIEHVSGARWADFHDASGVLPAATLVDALPAIGRVRVLSCDATSRRALPVQAVETVIDAGRRGHDVVVVDAANDMTDVTRHLCAAADLVVVTVAAEVRAVAAATALVAEVTRRCSDVRLVVRHPGAAGLRPRDVAEAVGAPVAAVWARDRRLARIVDSGRFSRGWRQTNLARVTARVLEAPGQAAR